MDYFIQLLVWGVTEGGIYVLVALGITITYKATKVINLAQGEYVVLGSLIVATLTGVGAPLPVSVVSSVACVGLLVGGAVGMFVFRPFLARGISVEIILAATVGVHMFLEMIAVLAWGRLPLSVPYFTGDDPIVLGQLRIEPQALWVLATSAVACALVVPFLERGMVGRALYACAENRLFARLVGINDMSMVVLACVVSASLGALAGAVVSPLGYARFDLGIMYTVNGFIAAVIGGLDKPMGALYGGMAMGTMSSISAGYLGGRTRDILVILALLLILVAKPTGLSAHSGETRHR